MHQRGSSSILEVLHRRFVCCAHCACHAGSYPRVYMVHACRVCCSFRIANLCIHTCTGAHRGVLETAAQLKIPLCVGHSVGLGPAVPKMHAPQFCCSSGSACVASFSG
jgi:hypothetical protein